MTIGMITEGTYPIGAGGVSQWCDLLLRRLPDIDFEVLALSGSGRERPVYDLPGNVSALHRLGLWGATPAVRRPTAPQRRRILAAYEELVEAVLADDHFAAVRFEKALRELRELARQVELTRCLRSQACVEVFLGVWQRRMDLGAESGPGRLTLADALSATDIVEHYLRPLHLPPLDVDVVHATANGPATMIGLLNKWERGTPVIVSEHGVYLRERIMWLRGTGDGRALRTVLVRFFVRLTELGYRLADRILPVSDFNGRWAVRAGAPRRNVRTVYNGIDPEEFPPAGREPEQPTLVFAGRIDPLKDLETLLRAFALVRGRVPGARLRLFGGVPSGNEAYAERCATLAADLGIADAAIFEGPVSPVRTAYAAGHVTVLSSLSEGLPLSVLEAAMSGRPTVATDVGGMAEAVGRGGLVVPARDPRALADACTRLLLDDRLRRRLADLGRRRALEEFTVDRMVGDFRAIYRDVVPGHEEPETAVTGAVSRVGQA
ncbi:Glycosyltransferase involved in cell wall bisynthesis [Pseudonocardia ammonioxydans]|uniref:Glycosyltransferase involved in cell wall bisynthesis n=1 Tax=Pseudonocardia ammonioxydans TaxID=260086 RepID=A0A1I5CJS1_PSUAM|nr:GT4 family glycosyltransferase PelF [Pseudonocardia ammonioxydans]SFN87270.1 Glycosyltransferase involved in cell wall bisynthesis [Pseudonocardia ammonioxydans]